MSIYNTYCDYAKITHLIANDAMFPAKNKNEGEKEQICLSKWLWGSNIWKKQVILPTEAVYWREYSFTESPYLKKSGQT